MKEKSKLEMVLEYLVNEDEDKARDLLHQVFVEKARAIHDELMAEDEDEVLEGNFDPRVAEDEIEYEEMYSDSNLGEMGDDDEENMAPEGGDMAADDLEDEMMGDDGDMDLGDEGMNGDFEDMSVDDKIDDLQVKLEMLKGEFEELQGTEEVEHGEDFSGDGEIGLTGDEETEEGYYEAKEEEVDEDDEEVDEDKEEAVDEDDEELDEMENYTDEQYSANKKQLATDVTGQNKVGNDPRKVQETAPNDQGDASKAQGATTDLGAQKGKPMSTDATHPTGAGEGNQGDSDDADEGANDSSEAGWPGKAMSTESVNLDDIFDELDESVLDELESVNVKMGGEQGGGKYAGTEYNPNSNLTQRKVGDRQAGERRLTSVQSEHGGFDKEDNPTVKDIKHGARKGNVRKRSTDGLEHKEKAGDKSAMLNSDDGFGKPQVVSPIGSKGTRGNDGPVDKG